MKPLREMFAEAGDGVAVIDAATEAIIYWNASAEDDREQARLQYAEARGMLKGVLAEAWSDRLAETRKKIGLD